MLALLQASRGGLSCRAGHWEGTTLQYSAGSLRGGLEGLKRRCGGVELTVSFLKVEPYALRAFCVPLLRVNIP